MESDLFDMVPSRKFTPEIAHLVMMLDVSKKRIVDTLSSLSLYELDYCLTGQTPTIATLLKHMVAVEEWFQVISFLNRDFNEEEKRLWSSAMPGKGALLDRTIKDNEFIFYAHLWNHTRKKTLQFFAQRDDQWLYSKNSQKYNHYFGWFHLMEDHLCHFGQIKMIRNRIPGKESGL
jgi:hypothetical protein